VKCLLIIAKNGDKINTGCLGRRIDAREEIGSASHYTKRFQKTFPNESIESLPSQAAKESKYFLLLEQRVTNPFDMFLLML
jgi:hypothetical protein